MAFIPVTLRDLFWTDPFFEAAWGDDFDLLRNDMLREHQRMWNRFGREFGNGSRCDNCLNNESAQPVEDKSGDRKEAEAKDGEKMETESGKEVAEREERPFWPWFMPPRRWLGPSFGFEEAFQNVGQLMRVKEDETKFEVSLDTHEYRPDEIAVNINNNVLSVQGKHEDKSEDGKTYVSRHFSRKYTLPQGCQADTVTSNLSADGVLMITAPKNPALVQGNRAVPIQTTQAAVEQDKS